MNNQELNNNPGFPSPESLDSPLPAAGNPNSAGKSIALNSPPCSSGSNKRHSPDSPLYAAENPKRIFTKPEHNTPFDFSHIIVPDFPKLAPGSTQTPSSHPVLCRCYSDPFSPPSVNQIPIIESPPPTPPVSKGTASLPPRPPLRRNLSDLSVNSNAKDLTLDAISDSQLRNKMISCVKEMNKCLDELVVEREASFVTESEETVSVERSGGCLVVHLKCCCGKSFDILLSGTDCYYKLH